MRHFKYLVVCFLLLFSGFAGAVEKGLLWKLEAPSGKVSYLFGTMHSDDPRINDYPPALVQALEASDTFMMEAFPPSSPDVFMMKDKTNEELLTEQEWEQVIALADVHSMHHDAAMRMKPWLLAVVFDLPKPQSDFSQDLMLAAMARDKGKRPKALESAEEHFSVLDAFSIDEQITMLRAVLKHTQEQKERDFETLLKAYQSGDTDQIGLTDEKITRGMLSAEMWQKMRTKLLTERNERMAERLASEANDGAVFAAMGASHLGGEDGVINRLRAKGYKLSVLMTKF